MNFFSKHYEKLLLGGLLLIFIMLLFILAAQREAPELKMNEIHKIDHRQVDFLDRTFDITRAQWLRVNSVWAPEVLEDGFVKDFSLPLVISRCPDCNILLEQRFFADGQRCHNPECGIMLVTPANEWARTRSDVEVVPPEELIDQDGDGFSYRYEKIAGTDPANPKDHPPLWHLLSTGDPRRTELGPGLRLVECCEDRTIPENSFAQFQFPDPANPGQQKQIQVWVGESIRSGGKDIVNGIPCKMTLVVGNDKNENEEGIVAEKDRRATITFTPEDGSESFSIVIYKKAPAYFAEMRVPLHGLALEDGRAVKEGDRITMGNNYIGLVQYVVVSSVVEYDDDYEKDIGRITLRELTLDGQIRENRPDIVIGPRSQVPESMLVQENYYGNEYYMNGGYYGGMLPGTY